jgi:hypothetical protein
LESRRQAKPACSLQNLRFWRLPGQAHFQFLIKLKQFLSGIGIIYPIKILRSGQSVKQLAAGPAELKFFCLGMSARHAF